MSRLPLIDPDVPGEAKATLDAVHAQLGMVPNLYRLAAIAPAALNALVAMGGALAKGHLRARVREQIAIAVAQQNGCDYCLSAHTAIGGAIGVNARDLHAARHGEATDATTEAMLGFALQIVRSRGHVTPIEIQRAKDLGIGDAEIVEIVAAVALNIFTNYLNIIADTDIDFPVVRTTEHASA